MGECEYDCECGRSDICGLWFVCVGGGFSVNEFLWLFDVEYVVVRRWAWVIIGVLVLVVLRGWMHICLFMCLFLSVCGCKTSKVL